MSRAEFTFTQGEILYIRRRREGLTQGQAAKRYGVSLDRYRGWEDDRYLEDQPSQEVDHIAQNEFCVTLRRREGMFQREVAADLGVSKLWVMLMETGKVSSDQLRDYWGF